MTLSTRSSALGEYSRSVCSVFCAAAGIPNRMRVIHNHTILGQWIKKIEPLVGANGTPLWKEHPIWRDRVDFVALPLTDLIDVKLYPHDLVGGPELAIGPAEPISIVGFSIRPAGWRIDCRLGNRFCGFRTGGRLQWLPIFLIDCRTRPGQSGSAAIMHRNGGSVATQDGSTNVFTGQVTKFQGIYSGRINDQSDIGIVWKAKAIAELIASI